MNTLVKYLNHTILRQASRLVYTIRDDAPNTESGLFSSTGLVVWAGASTNTIYQDETVNWAFRALHDALHLKTGLGFSIDHEVELGRIQANQFSSAIIQDIIYTEVSRQALYYKETGCFVPDQAAFTKQFIRGL